SSRGRGVAARLARAIALGLVVRVPAAFLHKLAPALGPSPPVGSGGYLGALVAIVLERYCGPVGLVLILAAIGLFGLALCHELLIVWPVQEARSWLRGWWGRGRPAPLGSRAQAAAILDDPPGGAWDTPLLLPDPATPAGVRVHPPIPVTGAAASAPSVVQTRPQVPALAVAGASAAARDLAPAVPPAAGALFQLPPLELLEPPGEFPVQEHEAKIHARAMLLERTLQDFSYQVRVV